MNKPINQIAGMKVLLVEDDDDLRELVADELFLQGAEVVKADSGNSALKEYAKHQNFDVILSDMRMPDGDGLHLIRSLKKNFQDVPPFIIVSGFSDLSADDIKREGIDRIFDKPFLWDDFLRCLAKYLPANKKKKSSAC